MYCANCGSPLGPGLSYCNRCGFSLRDKDETKSSSINAFLTAITTIGVVGLGVLIGGPVALRKAAALSQELIGVFMLFTFLLVSFIELMLIINLARLTGRKQSKNNVLPSAPHQDLRLPQASNLGEPVSSVTENTTRTLEYARREQ